MNETTLSPLDVVRSLRTEDIEQQILETEAELKALRELLKVAATREGKSLARPARSGSSGRVASAAIIAKLTEVLQDGPKSFAEIKELTGLERYALVSPLGNGPFHQLTDKRWSLSTVPTPS